MKMKTGCVLPVFQHFDGLRDLIPQILQFFENKDIVVVDDGSSDFDKKFLLEKFPGISIIHHDENKGKGAALCSGLRHLNEKDYDYALCLDADGQHNPQEIPLFLDQAGKADIVIGNRMNSLNDMPMERIMSNKISSAIIRWVSGLPVLDSQNGYRLVSLKKILELKLYESGFQFESEMLFAAGKNNLRLINVPVKTIYNNATSSIHHLNDTWRFIVLILKYIWR
jgi:glycosyltransferase involved in cell wall biosynthesis